MIKKITLNVYSDSGHGWVRVPMSLLNQLQITDKISCHSYKRGDFAYLEEDRDAYILTEAMKLHEIKYSYKEHHTNKSSKIRSYITFTQLYIWRQF